MSEFDSLHERNDKERSVEIIGPKLQPLKDRLLVEVFDGRIQAYETDDLFKRSGLPIIEMTEQEAIVDYYDFLKSVKISAQSDKSEEGETIRSCADLFAEKTTYLSHEDFRQAIKGLATRQEKFLSQDEGNSLIIFHRGQRVDNSQAYVSKKIVDTIDPHFLERVSIVTEETIAEALLDCDESKARVIVADDWSVTGHNISNDLANLLQLLHKNETLDIEVNLIAVRADQAEASFKELVRLEEVYGVRQNIPVVGYFETSAIRTPIEGPTPTGSWSSVDYGFEQRLAMMADYLNRKGVSCNIPAIAAIKRSYR